jgi:signal transduction histidine kinase
VNRWVVPVVCAAAQTVSVTAGGAPDRHVGGGLGLLAGLAAGLVLRWRLTAPLATLGGSVMAYGVQILLSGPAVPVAPAVAVFGASRRGATVRGPLAAVGATGVAAGALFLSGDVGIAPWYVALLLTAALAGLARAASAARTAGVRREAALQERVRLARDLHDAVGHGMSGITVQAGAARTALAAGSTAEAAAALTSIEAAGRTVLRDVRWLVGLLRAEEDAPALNRLPALADAARRAGLDVRLEVEGDLDQVDAAAGEATYRILQESLTNVLRHSGAPSVTIRADVRDGIGLTVTDDGTRCVGDGTDATARTGQPGTGIRGMQERAAAIGGTLDAGPRAGGGWSVALSVPRRPR